MVYGKVTVEGKEKKVGMCVARQSNETDLVLSEEHFLYHTTFFNNNTEYTISRLNKVFLKDKFQVISGINCGKFPRHHYKGRSPFKILDVSIYFCN